MRKVAFALLICLTCVGSAFAVPETVSVRVTDVTTSSCALVWMTDVAATPNVEVYGDSSMTNRLTDTVTVLPMPDTTQEAAAAARTKGVMKVRITGLAPGTSYYVRTITADPADPTSVGYSAVQEVTTASTVVAYHAATDGSLKGTANDVIPLKVYIRPSDTDSVPGLGSLLMLETPSSPYPVSAFIGVGTIAPEGVIDLNNLFGTDMTSLALQGGEKAIISIYRGGSLSTLSHYRRFPVNSSVVAVQDPVRGFFADVNLDGKVDDQDFTEFRKCYRSGPDDSAYNPDYNFVDDPNGKIDAMDFVKFAAEYGRTDVQ